jgi:hypothetical protein
MVKLQPDKVGFVLKTINDLKLTKREPNMKKLEM